MGYSIFANFSNASYGFVSSSFGIITSLLCHLILSWRYCDTYLRSSNLGLCFDDFFLKALVEAKNRNILKKLSVISKLVNFVDVKTQRQCLLGDWSTMDAQLIVASFDALVGNTLKSDIIFLNVQCGANWTLLGLHKQVPTTTTITKNQYTNCRGLLPRLTNFL